MWICIAPRREHTSKALRYGTRSQGISHFFLHIPRSSANGMNHTCLLPSQPKLVLIYRPRRDRRLSWPWMANWLHTEINVRHRELNPDTVAHFSTNRTRRWLTSLIKANALTTTPDHQPPWEDGSGEETTAKKVPLSRGRWLKYSRFFFQKIGWHHQLRPRVTPTLVTPLTACNIIVILMYYSCCCITGPFFSVKCVTLLALQFCWKKITQRTPHSIYLFIYYRNRHRNGGFTAVYRGEWRFHPLHTQQYL